MVALAHNVKITDNGTGTLTIETVGVTTEGTLEISLDYAGLSASINVLIGNGE